MSSKSKKSRFIVGSAKKNIYFCAANIQFFLEITKFQTYFFFEKMTALDIIYHFYPQDTELRRLLLLHSQCVADKSLQILDQCERAGKRLDIDRKLVVDGAMLHDIGICKCDARGILCEGTEPYICHGTIGAQMLRDYLAELKQEPINNLGVDLEACARICERHTGAGLTAQDIIDQQLPILPVRDLLPETFEEKLVCLADKFFSKSGDPSKEKELGRVCRSMEKFGADTVARFTDLRNLFMVP